MNLHSRTELSVISDLQDKFAVPPQKKTKPKQTIFLSDQGDPQLK